VADKQLELFPLSGVEALRPPAPDLTPADTLEAALGPFTEYMQQREFSANTIASFLNDLRLFMKFVGPSYTLKGCSPRKLEEFIEHLQTGRKAPCSPKSLDRRITTLKVFFGWLADKAVLAADPAAPLVRQGAESPLPRILTEPEVERVLEVARAMRDAEQSPDARPYLLLSLLLHTGMKKVECLSLELSDLDMADPTRPSVEIRYDKPRLRFKTRRLSLPPDFTETLQAYLRRYQPVAKLFECTPRNLEYVLHNVSLVAGLRDNLTFDALRWTAAVRHHRAGMDAQRLRRWLGLSKIAWASAGPLIEKLASEPL